MNWVLLSSVTNPVSISSRLVCPRMLSFCVEIKKSEQIRADQSAQFHGTRKVECM
jgi:hypothetical protein